MNQVPAWERNQLPGHSTHSCATSRPLVGGHGGDDDRGVIASAATLAWSGVAAAEGYPGDRHCGLLTRVGYALPAPFRQHPAGRCVSSAGSWAARAPSRSDAVKCPRGYSSDRTSPGQWFAMVEALAGGPCSAEITVFRRRGWRHFRLRVDNQVAITHRVVGDGELEYSVEDQPSAARSAPVRSAEYPRVP